MVRTATELRFKDKMSTAVDKPHLGEASPLRDIHTHGERLYIQRSHCATGRTSGARGAEVSA